MQEKPTLVLVPGLLCDREVWSHQADHLAGSCRIVVPDFSGCSSLGEILSCILEGAPETFLLAGHSMGGWLAFEILKRHPERIAKLCLLDTTGETDSPSIVERRIRMMKDAKSGKIADVIEGIIRAFVFQKDAVPAVRGMFLRNQKKFLIQEEMMLSRGECLSGLPRAPLSPLLVVGSEDRGFLPSMSTLHRMMPTSRLEVIGESGHMSTMEKPTEVTALMHDWIGRP
jgi:pimeloyl-ACP methyl ester carboxylesterase